MANTSSAVFSLFVNDKASEIFKKVGQTARGSSKSTKDLANDVDTASRKMIAASNKTLTAQGRVGVEQKKLDELRGKSNATASQLTAQEERLSTANRNAALALRNSTAATEQLGSAQDIALTSAKRAENGLHRVTKGLGLATKAFVVYRAAAFVKASITEAAANETAQNKLSQAYKNSGSSLDAHGKSVEELSGKFVKLGYDQATTKDAFSVLVTSLKDPTKAMALMATTANLARYKNIPLAESAFIVAKATEGQLKPLKALAIDLPVAAGGALELERAHTALAKAQANLDRVRAGGKGNSQAQINAQARLNTLLYKFNDPAQRTAAQIKQISNAQLAVAKASKGSGDALVKAQQAFATAQKQVNDAQSAGTKIGAALSSAVANQAEMYSKSTAGQLDTAKAQWKEFQDSAGTVLLPGLKTGLTDLQSLFDLVKGNKGVFEALGIAMATIWAASKGVAIASFATTTAKSLGIIRVAAAETAVAESAAGGAILGPVAGIAAAAAMALALGVAFSGGKSPAQQKKDDAKVKTAEKVFAKNFTVGPQGVPDIRSKPSALTSTTSSTGPTVHVEVHGSVVTEKKLVDTIHNGIAQNMKRAGVDPKVIAKK